MDGEEKKDKGALKPYGYYMLMGMLCGIVLGVVIRNVSIGLVLGLLGGIIYYNVLRKRNNAGKDK